MRTKKITMITVLALICLLLSACENGKQVVDQIGDGSIRKELDLSGFDEIAVSHMFDVEIRQGDYFHVTVEVDQSLESYLRIITRGKTLSIGLKPDNQYNFQNASHRVEVILPVLKRVEITNKSSVIIQDFSNLGDIDIEVTDFGSLSADIRAETVRVDIRDHSSVILIGVVEELAGNIEGLSTLNLSRLNAREVSVAADQLSEIKE